MFLLAPWLSIENFWYQGGYTILLIQSIFYLAIATLVLFKHRKEITDRQLKSPIVLISGVFIFLFTYFSNYQLRLNPYYYAPVVYAAVVYFLSFYLIRSRALIFSSGSKYRNINLEEQQAENYKVKIIRHYENTSPFLNNEYSLTKLSEELHIPKHLLSLIFSSKIKTSFIDFTNAYRVEVAKELLVRNPNFTVSSVAYDCGFNSLSSFNQAFKKVVKTTPSRYRDKHAN